MDNISKHLKQKHPWKWKKTPASISFFWIHGCFIFHRFLSTHLFLFGRYLHIPSSHTSAGGKGPRWAIYAAISTGHPSICPPSTGNFLSEGRVIPWFRPTRFPTSECSLKFMIKCPKLALKMDGWQMKFLSGMANF